MSSRRAKKRKEPLQEEQDSLNEARADLDHASALSPVGRPESDLRMVGRIASAHESDAMATYPTKGLLSLPVELFNIIVSEFGTISEFDILSNSPYLPSNRCERHTALRALSQTCRVMRVACLPISWERFSVCTLHSGSAWYKQISKRLEVKSLGLARHPDIAKHVRVCTVALTRCSTDTVLPAFARCLEHLPNLHTLQIVHAHSQMTTALKNAFESKKYPQIRTIILPSCAHNILRACPAVTHVTCNEDDGGKLVTAIGAACLNVQAIYGILLSEAIIKRLAKAAPHLRELGIGAISDFPHQVSLLANLSSISMIVKEGTGPHTQLIDDARNVLRKNKSAGTKQVILKHSIWDQPPDCESSSWKTVHEERIQV